MSKPRIIDEGFWDDERIAMLTIPERLLVIALITAADDWGRVKIHDGALKRLAFALDDDVSLSDVAAMREHILETYPNLQAYQENGQTYGVFAKYQSYQQIRYRRESRLPRHPRRPDLWSEKERKESESEAIPTDSRKLPQSAADSRLSRVGLCSVEKGRKEKPQRKNRAEASDHQRLMDLYQKALGYQIPNGGQEGKAAKKLLAKHTPEEVIACYSFHKARDFWADKHLSLVSIQKNIGPWVQAGRPQPGMESQDRAILEFMEEEGIDSLAD